MRLVKLSDLSGEPPSAWQCRRRELLLHPPERVWRALVQPEELERWWCDRAGADIENERRFIFGGTTLYPGCLEENAPAARAVSECPILRADEPSLLVYRWALDGVETTVRFELESHLEATRLTVLQSAERSPAWEGAETGPNWWSVALPALRSYLEDGSPDLRVDYGRVRRCGELHFEVAATTFPWIVWTKLTEPREAARWWGSGPRQVLEHREGERFVHEWRWGPNDLTRVEWRIQETEEDTLLSVTDRMPPANQALRVERAIFWASKLLALLELSEKGVAAAEHDES